MLGATYASVFPTSRHHQQVRLADLDGLKIVDAKYDGGVLMSSLLLAGDTIDGRSA